MMNEDVPDHALVVDKVENVFSNLELAILWEILFQVPAPAAIEDAYE